MSDREETSVDRARALAVLPTWPTRSQIIRASLFLSVAVWAVDQGYIEHSPIARLKKPKPAIIWTFSSAWPTATGSKNLN